jgi:hypothetical protein
MAWIKVRVTDDGDKRFVACYRDREGRQRSAGTYSSRRAANREKAKVPRGPARPLPGRGHLRRVRRDRSRLRDEHRRGIAWCRHADCVIGTARLHALWVMHDIDS